MKIKTRIVLVLTFVLILLLYIQDIQEISTFTHDFNQRKLPTQEYTIDTTGCVIPYLNINDTEIISLLGKPDTKFSCGVALVRSNLTSLYLDSNAFKKYGIENLNQVNCYYKPFWRVDPQGNESDTEIQFGEPYYFISSVDVQDEFVRVDCKFNKIKYQDFHSFIPTRKPISKINTIRTINDEKLNVIIIGIDNLSRLQFNRKMPRTAKFLTEELNAIEYFGYNKVGATSFPNIQAVLTGSSFGELKKFCMPNLKSTFDNCTFIFGNYSKNGYVTNFAEESDGYGLFNYHEKGWLRQPTDYYWASFDFTARNATKKSYRTGYPRCISVRPVHQVLLQQGEKFITKMKDHRFFSYLWATTLTHGDYDTATLGENDYIKHLKFLKGSGILNSTILIIMSDHGYRYGKIPATFQGYFEERLPFIFFVLPAWFQTKYPIAVANMKNNAFRLTTPYDLHSTLNHILYPWYLKDEYVRDEIDRREKSVSFFLPISSNRTCASAKIPIRWCTCKKEIPIVIP